MLNRSSRSPDMATLKDEDTFISYLQPSGNFPANRTGNSENQILVTTKRKQRQLRVIPLALLIHPSGGPLIPFRDQGTCSHAPQEPAPHPPTICFTF